MKDIQYKREAMLDALYHRGIAGCNQAASLWLQWSEPDYIRSYETGNQVLERRLREFLADERPLPAGGPIGRFVDRGYQCMECREVGNAFNPNCPECREVNANA